MYEAWRAQVSFEKVCGSLLGPHYRAPVIPFSVGRGWVPGGSSHTEPEEVLGDLWANNPGKSTTIPPVLPCKLGL